MAAEQKIILLGNQGVGKTALVTRLVHNVFEESYTATIGVDFFTKTLMLDNKPVKFQMWDTAGQERFVCLLPSYIRGSTIALILYDITNKASFDDVSKWIVNVRSERGSNIVIGLVGNKLDMESDRQVPVEDAQLKAAMMGIFHIEASAKTGENVNELLQVIMDEAMEYQKQERVLPVVEQAKKILLGKTETSGETPRSSNEKCSC